MEGRPIALTRTSLYAELQVEEHYRVKIHQYETAPDEVPQYLREKIQREQHGKEYHGQLVVTAHTLLTEFYDLYPSFRQCYLNTSVEAIGTGMHCDLYDESNKFIIDATERSRSMLNQAARNWS